MKINWMETKQGRSSYFSKFLLTKLRHQEISSIPIIDLNWLTLDNDQSISVRYRGRRCFLFKQILYWWRIISSWVVGGDRRTNLSLIHDFIRMVVGKCVFMHEFWVLDSLTSHVVNVKFSACVNQMSSRYLKSFSKTMLWMSARHCKSIINRFQKKEEKINLQLHVFIGEIHFVHCQAFQWMRITDKSLQTPQLNGTTENL